MTIPLPADALPYESVPGISARFRQDGLSPVSLVEDLLARIEALDPRLHSFLVLTRERALAEASAADGALRAGRARGPLHGIPYAAKDLFDVKGEATTAGTRLRAQSIAAADCAVVERLSRAGMVLVGKTHTVQLAYGVVGLNGDQGTPINPWHHVPHVPGGSSSGSAVAVAAGLVPVALGTDTGGSVRIPAALCGIVGLKTTVGRVSRAGVYPLSPSFDSIGPLARSVEDAALVYDAVQGEDPRDASTVGAPADNVLRHLKDGVRGLRLAVGETVFFDDADPEVATAVRDATALLQSLGATVESIAVPEAASVWNDELRRFYVAAEACVVNRDLLDRHFDALDPFVSARMIVGRSLSPADYAALTRKYAALRVQLEETLRGVDALLVPTTPIAAPRIADAAASPEAYAALNMRLHRNAGFGNHLDLCGVSLPCGFTAEGLPIGLMIYAKPFREDLALRVAYAYERATDWHMRRPDLVAWASVPDAP